MGKAERRTNDGFYKPGLYKSYIILLMATKESLPLSSPPPTGAPTPPNTPPIRPQLEPSAGDAQKKRLFMIVGGAVIFLILIGAVPLLVLGGSKKPAATPTPSTSATPKPSNEPSLTKDQSTRFPLKSGATTLTFDMTVTAPVGWNASFTTTPSSPSYPWTGAVLITAIKSNFSPLTTGNTNVSSGNFLAIMDTTEWLKTNQATPALTATQKQAWFAAASTLTAETVGSAASLVNPAANKDQGRVNLNYAQSQDASLRGFTYLTQPTAGRYEPLAVTILAGTVGGKSFVLYGRHTIHDKQWSTLSTLQSSGDASYATQRDAAVAAFAAGTVSEDTAAIHAELLKAVQSLKFIAAG